MVINIIPANSKMIYWLIEDKIDFDAMTLEENNTVRFILYYNTDSPIVLIPDFGTYETVFFFGDFMYPEKFQILCKKV
jgi:hypothetical protein